MLSARTLTASKVGKIKTLVITTVGTKVTDYVVTSAENLDALMEAQEKATEQRTLLQASSNQLQLALADASRQVIVNGDHINQLQELMKEAYDVMKASVEKREKMQQEQIDLLKKLELGIGELNRLTAEATQSAVDNAVKAGGG